MSSKLYSFKNIVRLPVKAAFSLAHELAVSNPDTTAFCVETFKPDTIIAETDDDAVGFYRKVGFSVLPLGDKYNTGINRYLCTLTID